MERPLVLGHGGLGSVLLRAPSMLSQVVPNLFCKELQLLKQGQAKLQAHLDSITGNYSASTVDTSRGDFSATKPSIVAETAGRFFCASSRGDSFRPRYVRTATNCDLFPRVHLF